MMAETWLIKLKKELPNGNYLGITNMLCPKDIFGTGPEASKTNADCDNLSCAICWNSEVKEDG